jgi:release factor glutamine methyltransferase
MTTPKMATNVPHSHDLKVYPHVITGATLWAWREAAIAQTGTAQIDPVEVDWLLRGLCHMDALSLRLGTLAQQAEVLAQVSLPELDALWAKRIRDRVPIQQLVGVTAWRNFSLRVSPEVLIPRPETELIIDIAQQLVEHHPDTAQLRQGTWVDLGTGSGAIALGLAEQFPQAEILAVDVSATALAIAQQNAIENGFGDRIQFLQGSWFEPLTPWRGQLAGVVSNPPYIPSAIVSTLEPEVVQHEPHLALDGGCDGLDAVQHLIRQAPDYLQVNGIWLVELMIGQAPTVTQLLANSQHFHTIQSFSDFAAVERFVAAQKRGD